MPLPADAVARVITLQEQAEGFAAKYAKRADGIDNAILIFSVVTSGAMWALAADVLSKLLGWVGAAISTIVTLLTIYMYASGLRKKRKKAVVIHSEITRFLGRLRGQTVEQDEYWDTYKGFEAELTTLRYGQED